MRHNNSHHLLAAAQRRRADTLERARKALQALGETGQRRTVTQIAAHAGVSRSWLYAQPELRDQLRATDRHIGAARAGIRPNRARLRRLPAPTPHPRPRTHPRTRRRKPSTAEPCSRWRWFSAQKASPGVSAQAIGAEAKAMKLLSAAAVLRQVLIEVMSIPCSRTSGRKPLASFFFGEMATQLYLSVTGGYFLPPVLCDTPADAVAKQCCKDQGDHDSRLPSYRRR